MIGVYETSDLIKVLLKEGDVYLTNNANDILKNILSKYSVDKAKDICKHLVEVGVIWKLFENKTSTGDSLFKITISGANNKFNLSILDNKINNK